MRYALAAVILAAAVPAHARSSQPTDSRQVSNEQVRQLCVEITGKEAGHPLRDCMSSVDLFLERHAVPRAAP
ncbi:hypothetical protein [Methylobacterium oryzae]|uniref:3',5'-cyclic-nucleotide phosphodiesterase n=1 Tax=Methylobacterium oryzae TaxID=334852 RepID=A0ABU7TIJ1_9HYPH